MRKPMSAATWGTTVITLLSLIRVPTSQAAQSLAQIRPGSMDAISKTLGATTIDQNRV
jgi:hypothetical protein